MRRSAVVLLIAVLIFGAVFHRGAALPAIILIPLLFCFAVVLCFTKLGLADLVPFLAAPDLPALASRPPPSLLP